MASLSSPTFVAALPLAWSPDDDQAALSEQLQQVENQIRALDQSLPEAPRNRSSSPRF